MTILEIYTYEPFLILRFLVRNQMGTGSNFWDFGHLKNRWEFSVRGQVLWQVTTALWYW